jgi:hypothetical protein
MELKLDDTLLLLWPALHLLKGGRRDAPSESLLTGILERRRLIRPLAYDLDSLIGLKSPASTDRVLDWLRGVRRRIVNCDRSALTSERHAIMAEITGSGLSEEDQARLLTALDYLYRFSAAEWVSRVAGMGLPALIPRTKNQPMQAAYRKLAGLAATDLPIWLAGERGTELEWAGRLVHRLRGGEDKDFNVLDVGGASYEGLRDRWADLALIGRPTGLETILVKRVDEAPERFRRDLHELLMADLRGGPSLKIMVASGPINLAHEIPRGVFPDLFALLSPTRVEIPPLRRRLDDLAGLISFFAVSGGREDPTARFSPEATEALSAYHWPGNTEELEAALAYILKKRPSGHIRREDLPENILPPSPEEDSVVSVLEAVHREDGFRALATDEKRRGVARFLLNTPPKIFTAVDFQSKFDMGRETVRRLLAILVDRGLLTGLKGAKGKRITRYKPAVSTGNRDDSTDGSRKWTTPRS